MRIAVAQTPGTRLEQWRETLALIDEQIARAADLGGELVVLPECVWPAYCLGSKEAYFAARAAGLPSPSVFLDRLTQHARGRGIAICAGYVEETADGLANAACLVDAAGRLLGVHRKCFLWDFDHDHFEPGKTIEPIATAWGCVGLMVCADARLPEIPATLARRGAQLILQPTGWVSAGTAAELWNPQPDFLIASRAGELGVPIVSASKWGAEAGTTFVGSSLICDARGNVLVQCGQRETAVVLADVTLDRPRRAKISASQRAALLSPAPPACLCSDVSPLDVLPVGPGVPESSLEARLRNTEQDANPILALLSTPGQPRGHCTLPARRKRSAILCKPTRVPFCLGGARIAATKASAACSFAALRRLALQGVHLVALFGDECPMRAAQTRACENRIFVIVVRSDGWTAIDPRGRVIRREAWSPAATTRILRLIVAEAADKMVACRTDVLRDRRPGQYDF